MKTTIVASKENYGLLFDRFQKFVRRNSDKKIELKNVWGKPQKSEKWDRSPVNNQFGDTPKIEKHLLFGAGSECLFGICPSTLADAIKIHYGGDSSSFYRRHQGMKNFDEIKIYTKTIKEGDKIIFKNEGIIVTPKRKDAVINETCTWKLTAN